MGDPRYRSLRQAVTADIGRAVAMAAGGAVLFAPIEYALTLWAYSGSVEFTSKLRLAALTLTLALWLWLVLAIWTAAAMIGARLVRGVFDPPRARELGWFVPAPPVAGVRPGVPQLWATLATLGAVGAVVQRAAVWADVHYVEPELTAIVIAVLALVAFGIAFPLRRLFGIAADVGAHALAPMLRLYNPLGRWRAAGIACAAMIGGVLAAMWFVLPQSRSVLPVRLAITFVVIALGMGRGAELHARIARRPGVAHRPRRRGYALAIGAAALVLNVATLYSFGADLETKYVAITASPALDHLIKLVRASNDLDRDGFGSLLGENDCAPFDKTVHPGATDLPDDGIDQNCDGRDFTLRPSKVPSGPTVAVPDQFKRSDWNVLLITIDTVRYDHTTFGGYKDSPKQRDTTPRLAEFARKSTSFTFCNAPSAGTMASIPAILTSKFFHSGLALDENLPPGNPPKIKPENTTLPEIMKRAGYATGVVASHPYWNNWGLDQGVDDYDNSIGKNGDPYIVAADKVTDHTLAWISREQGHKWFMWAHYIDPHGRYVAHPDVIDYGTSEPDLYDAELRWTDQQLGRLFDELVRLPSNEKTIIIITSDHGDSMGEHTVPVGTHGTALYRELLHTPLLVYVPNNQPREVGGAVTSLDIIPTITDILGIDTHDLSFEGKSLVPQIFYGKAEHDRIVFSETNAPSPQRAAISEAWKLIFYVHSNLYELYDLKADPWEKANLAPKNPPAMQLMKTALDAWLERVLYARDTNFNQASKSLADLVLPAAPKLEVTTQGQTLDDGKLEIIGIGLADTSPPPAPNARVDIDVYFHVKARTQVAYRFLLAVWPVTTPAWKPTDPAPPNLQRSPMRPTGDGFFPSDRWRAGEYIRDKFSVTIPADWLGNGLAVGLVASDPGGEKAVATGGAPANDANLIVLGALPLGP
ncbi:MAG TPA: sulfatase-like hydrolase/transferase, partial [Kofleriaceae bacterium]